MKHVLKIWPQYYAAVAEGRKNFEIRKNDRGFNAGDLVELREWNPETHEVDDGPHGTSNVLIGFTKSPPLIFRIGYVLPIDAERVVFSLIDLDPRNLR